MIEVLGAAAREDGGLKVGSRVGAILMRQGDTAFILGYGKIAEDEIPCDEATGVGDLLRELGRKTTTILLDNGDKVYGYECHYAPEAAVRSSLEGTDVKAIDIHQIRVAIREREEADSQGFDI